MSALSQLQNRARETLLSAQERGAIDRSIANLQQKLGGHFGDDISQHFRFGSTTRGTNLPRAFDEHSDVDYMVVFGDYDKAPQTYLDRLRVFAETYYRRSEIRQSHPTVVLELNHIKFDLVPAVKSWWEGLQIPDKDRSWQSTDPAGFNVELTNRNAQCDDLLKPAIRLIKRWNAANGYPFDSYDLERWIVGNSYWTCNNLRDYVFAIFDKMAPESGSQRDFGCIARAQQRVVLLRDLEYRGATSAAEAEVARLIP